MLFQLLLFFKKLFKAPTREFIVFNCCSCTRLKFAVNELISLRCSSMPENDALNGLLLVAFARSSLLALFLLIFLWVLFNFCCLRLQRSLLHCLLPQRHQYQSWSLLEQLGQPLALLVRGDSHVLDWLAEWFSGVAGSGLINYRNGGCL